jgi:DNA (cytosine-5)-methyltransferase 1
VERVLDSGKFNPARADRPSPTIKATMHKGSQNDEPYVIVETNQTTRNGPNERSVDEPSSSIDSRCDQRQIAVGGMRLRRLTPRECARLQSVPDDYVFHGPLTATYRQVGNGVPPLFARHLARAVREYLAGRQPCAGK